MRGSARAWLGCWPRAAGAGWGPRGASGVACDPGKVAAGRGDCEEEENAGSEEVPHMQHTGDQPIESQRANSGSSVSSSCFVFRLVPSVGSGCCDPDYPSLMRQRARS